MTLQTRAWRLTVCVAAGVLLTACGNGNGNGNGNGEANGDDQVEADAGEFDDARALFTADAQPACATCHTLADAQATGTIGPNLDNLGPTAELVEQALRSGPGQMPDYSDTLSDDEIEALAAYVEAVAGNG